MEKGPMVEIQFWILKTNIEYGTGGSFRSKTLLPISAAHTFAINKNYAQLTLSMKNF